MENEDKQQTEQIKQTPDTQQPIETHLPFSPNGINELPNVYTKISRQLPGMSETTIFEISTRGWTGKEAFDNWLQALDLLAANKFIELEQIKEK